MYGVLQIAPRPAPSFFNEHTNEDGATVFRLACKLRFERIVSKRLAAPYLSDRIGTASRDGAARCREGRPGHDGDNSTKPEDVVGPPRICS